MIDEFISLFQPLVTFLILGLLGYFVHGYIVRQRQYNQYPDACETIYKPLRIKEDKHLFEDEDPWLQTFEAPVMETSHDLNRDYETIVKNQNAEDNSVPG